MKKVKEVINLINYNIWTLVGFESFFKIISVLIFMPLFLNTFEFITKVTGYNYLTFENISSFLLNPLTIIMLICLFLLMMIYVTFDISTIIIILDASYQKKKITISDAIRVSIKKCQKIGHIKNLLLAFLVLFLIPFLNIGISSSFISTIKIPEFIFDFILKNKILFMGVSLIIFILILLLLRWIYSLHYFILEDKSFKEARKASKELGYKNHGKDLITLILVQVVISIIYYLILILGILVIILISKLFKNIMLIKSFSTTIIWIFIAIMIIVFTVLATPISYATISIMYYFHKNKKQEKIKHISFKESNKIKFSNVNIKKVGYVLGIIALIGGTVFTYLLYKGKYNFNIVYTRTLEVTAHRGASLYYPENTIVAFKGAKELGADWIELDVQQTKDKKIIVIHDTNFKRTTGVSKNTWEMNYEDVKELDAGSFLDKKYKDERIPLLEEVISFAKKNNIKLNIELKPTGYEKDFEKSVVNIIKKMNFEKECVITSQVYSVLEKVKKYEPSIETVYVMSLAYGNITDLKAADHFSIEASSVNKKLVNKVHNEGKEIYVWTINTKDSIEKMIDLNVDNIITDNISLAKETIYASKTSNIVNEYIKLVGKIF